MSEDLEQTREAVERMHSFDTAALPRRDELGATMSFDAAVEPAKQLIEFYHQLSLASLEDLPDKHLEQVRNRANADYSRFDQILTFDSGSGNPRAQRDNLVKQVEDAYAGAFDTLWQYIAYSVSKSADFQRLENDARASVQASRDESGKLMSELEEAKANSKQILADIRKTAGEQGVSQESHHFKTEADSHETHAETWRNRTIMFAWVLAGYAALTFVLHKIEFFRPDSGLESAQLIASKLLGFGVISYMLMLSARNFLSHRHNFIVNRHRQNALMTYKALVDASEQAESRDTVLVHASACIFSPQETGYTKSSATPSSRSIVDLVPRTSLKLDS